MGYMRKLKFTEEFLWKLYEFHEGLTKVHEPFAQRSMREALHPELREIRLAYDRYFFGFLFLFLIYHQLGC